MQCAPQGERSSGTVPATARNPLPPAGFLGTVQERNLTQSADFAFVLQAVLLSIVSAPNSILNSPGAVVLRPQQHVHQRPRERQIGLHRACIAATVQQTVALRATGAQENLMY